MYKRGLFHDWVPAPVQLLLIIVLTIPMLTINGIYISNVSEMTGTLGLLSEDFMMANYAAPIGMMVAFPLIARTKQRYKSKTMLLGCFTALILLSYLCASTDNAVLIIIASFLTGIVKMLGMIEVILPIMFLISPQGERSRFYSVFYPLSIGMSMLSAYFSSLLAYQHNWQLVYTLAIPFMLVCMLLVLVFCHSCYASKPVRMYQFDWLSLVILSAALLLVDFVFCYGKVLSWFDSFYFNAALFTSALLALWFARRQLMLKRPYLLLGVIKKKNVYVSLIFFFLMGAFFSSSNIQSAFTTGILKYSSQTNAYLNLMMAAGALAGGIMCYFWFEKKLKIKGLVFTGFSLFIVYHIVLYFLFGSIIELRYLLFPSFIKGLAMTLLYIALGLYAAEKLSMAQMQSCASILILFRSFLGPAFWSAVYSFALYTGQAHHLRSIAERMDTNDPFFTSRYNPVMQMALSQGQSAEAAQTLATQSMWAAVQAQATLTASKEIFGFIILAGFLVLILVLLTSFGSLNLRPWVKIRKKLRKNKAGKEEEEMMAAVAP